MPGHFLDKDFLCGRGGPVLPAKGSDRSVIVFLLLKRLKSNTPHKPWRRFLREDCALPSSVAGPVERRAFARLADTLLEKSNSRGHLQNENAHSGAYGTQDSRGHEPPWN